ncbi:zeta toxin family protein [Olivibacter sitiensis]|uniref:zeta toxin family protein n=1 Tax=Olivibacter sitiensis TaxID=376470 RepID=UPI0004029A2B|nr:zeta toxin family protein [Olivibacter sitiensis]
MKPQFFILAGPNGAGKSTYGHEHIPKGTHIFNGDLVYAELLQKYPDYDPEKLKGGVPTRLENERDEAIVQRSDFAFESNYSNDLAIEITETFKNAGYETNLIYFGLEDVETATIRVDTRVRLGGHFIDTEEIIFNYEEGIKRVQENMHRYDRVEFVDTSIKGIAPVIAYYLKEHGKHVVLNPNIGWFNSQFNDRLLEIAIQRINDLSSQLEKRQKPENKQRGIGNRRR